MDRRCFLHATLALGASSLLPTGAQGGDPASRLSNPLGVFAYLEGDPDKTLRHVADMGFSSCELYTEDFRPEATAALREAMERRHIRVTALFTMGPGPLKWTLAEGPLHNGLVPREHRTQRIERLKQAASMARDCGIPAIETEAGFMPEIPSDPLYRETIDALREVVRHCRDLGTTFLYHAGTETPVTMLRVLEDVGLDNQGVGLDTANLILFGKGHPIDALDVYGRHVRAVNAKDGLWPIDTRGLGREVPIGEGRVDFPRLIRKLLDLKYSGPIIIERETTGPQQIEDIKRSKTWLESLLNA